MQGYVALVLHAHLPYVRHPEHERSLEERWFYEALWECYLPLLDVLGRRRALGGTNELTISLSPPLLCMLKDELLRRRFLDHIGRLETLALREKRRLASDPALGAVVDLYVKRLARARALWEEIDGDVVSALVAHHDAGLIELITTSASHAYLPGLAQRAGSHESLPSAGPLVRAQIRLGLRAFETITGRVAAGFWLPECAYDIRLGGDLAGAGIGYTLADAHGLELATPRPSWGVYAPVLAPTGVAMFARDPDSSRQVWSRQSGYPGDFDYREFYRDAGFDAAETDLADHLGPRGTRLMTGLKYHRITGPGPDKAPYQPAVAEARAREHAAHFVRSRELKLRELAASGCTNGIIVAPYDAELFGHWWFEGPDFIEAVLSELAASAKSDGACATTLANYLERHPEAVVCEPATSTWGEGGFAEAWAGPKAAPTWRHIHHAGADVMRATLQAARRASPGANDARGVALDQAIRELLLLESSDWPFMLWRGETDHYAASRIRAHYHRATRLAAMARGDTVSDDDASWLASVVAEDRFLGELTGSAIRDAFDAW